MHNEEQSTFQLLIKIGIMELGIQYQYLYSCLATAQQSVNKHFHSR